MIKFTVKGLIALFVTSSTLFLTPMKSDAQVNMKILAEVADSCHKDVPSTKYYQQMRLDNDQIHIIINSDYRQEKGLLSCINYRYYYSLILDKFPELTSTGEILPGYPGSVAVGRLAILFGYDVYDKQLLDCIISQNVSSDVCNRGKQIALNEKYKSKYRLELTDTYLPYVCPSCVVAHDDVQGSQEAILKAFIEWLIKLDKPQRKEVTSILGDESKDVQLRNLLGNESKKAVEEYQEIRAIVEQEEKERRRRELLGN